jgi:ribose 5-phosphate isomerase RpiB
MGTAALSSSCATAAVAIDASSAHAASEPSRVRVLVIGVDLLGAISMVWSRTRVHDLGSAV